MSSSIRTNAVKIFFAVVLLLLANTALAHRILFIGNSFTYAQGSALRFYRADSVTDLNGQGIGGVPALFKSFTAQADLSYDVYLETEPGVSVDWHIEHKLDIIGQRPWDVVVIQGHSTLDAQKPGDATALVASVHQLAEFLRSKNPAIDIRLTATWSRADQTYEPKGAWYGKPIEAMARDVRAGYDRAAKDTAAVKSVVPVGEAWTRAMHEGIADPNPYDGIDAGKVDLWTYDNYHASTYGYYLEALMLFAAVTGQDPRSLGANECSGFELGLSPVQMSALQNVAFEQMAAEGTIKSSPPKAYRAGAASRCRR
jgi:hypothetical protein